MTFDEAVRTLATNTGFALGAAGLAVTFWIRAERRAAAPRLRKFALVIALIGFAYGLTSALSRPYATPWIGWWYSAATALFAGAFWYLLITGLGTIVTWLYRQFARVFLRKRQT